MRSAGSSGSAAGLHDGRGCGCGLSAPAERTVEGVLSSGPTNQQGRYASGVRCIVLYIPLG